MPVTPARLVSFPVSNVSEWVLWDLHTILQQLPKVSTDVYIHILCCPDTAVIPHHNAIILFPMFWFPPGSTCPHLNLPSVFTCVLPPGCSSVAALTDCMRNKTLAKFFRERQALLKCSLPLGSYLLKPVQRILKYHLLLQVRHKHSWMTSLPSVSFPVF